MFDAVYRGLPQFVNKLQGERLGMIFVRDNALCEVMLNQIQREIREQFLYVKEVDKEVILKLLQRRYKRTKGAVI